ncbi:MAG: phage holin family protein [Oscillospiraceae bacterium]|nr:phage holin family protein [Oscillospiraceae bacterium]
MEISGITSVAVITVICYLAASGVKATKLDNKWLPTICGVLGGALGVIARFAMPGFPAGDVLTAIAVGIVSGLAATGGYEAVTQLLSGKGKS